MKNIVRTGFCFTWKSFFVFERVWQSNSSEKGRSKSTSFRQKQNQIFKSADGKFWWHNRVQWWSFRQHLLVAKLILIPLKKSTIYFTTWYKLYYQVLVSIRKGFWNSPQELLNAIISDNQTCSIVVHRHMINTLFPLKTQYFN